jgi:signal peptidase I
VSKVVGIVKEYDWKGLIRALIHALILALMFRSFIYEPYKVPTGSMIPTLMREDYLFVSKYIYGYSRYSLPFGIPLIKGRVFYSQPERGDIIVFKLPKDTSQNYIKRLVGLPGDTIQVVNGVLHINSQAVTRVKKGNYLEKDSSGVIKTYDVFEEILPNGVKYNTLYINNGVYFSFSDNTPPYEVPKGHFFFMGDNRNDSIDSRYLDKVGYVPENNLIGRATYLFMTEDFSIFKFIKNLETGRAFTQFNYAN